MSLRMIVGRAGTGKTHTCLSEMREKLKQEPDGSPLVMLVPDQMTFQAEYNLMKTPELGGITRAGVYSFSRLTLNVLQQTGGITRNHVSAVGINMMLRKIIEDRKHELKIFTRASDQKGFYELLQEMVTEFKHYCFSPDALARLLEDVDAFPVKRNRQEVLADKLHDLHLIYEDLEEALSGTYIDTDDYMGLLAEKLPLADFMRGAEVWVDGFYSFTPQERLVLEGLMKQCKRVTITLTLDRPYEGSAPNEIDLFHPAALTYRKLITTAEEAGTTVESPVQLVENKRQEKRAALKHLEKHYEQRPPKPFHGKEGIRLSAAVNRRSEVEGTARKIVKLARDEGLRWRDIAVLTRDLGTYHDLVKTILEDYEIPAFVDQRRSMLHHPLIELIRSSLEVITQNWRYEAVFRCVKTDLLFPADAGTTFEKLREDMDQLENYVLAHGIYGKQWKPGREWTYRRYYGLDGVDIPQTDHERKEERRINELKEMIAAPLARLQRDMKKAKKHRDRCEALYLFLETLDVPAKIESWRNKAEEAGQLETAREHDQVWSAVIELFDQMVEMVGEKEGSTDVFAKMIETGLDTMRFALVPPALDRVLVGSLDRTRSVDVRAVFILGVNEGVIPAKPPQDGILSEEEREMLYHQGVELAPGSRRQLLDEDFLIYLSLTGAKERLWISYPLADEEGKALQPSILMNRLKTIFPDVSEELLGGDPRERSEENQLAYMTNPLRTLSYTARQLGEWRKGYPISDVWWDAYNWFVTDEDWRQNADRMLGGLFYQNNEKKLTRETTKSLYGETIQASVSRMERFQSCPFQQFASHGLRLKERDVYRLEAPDIGQLFHSALKSITEHLQAEKRDWGDLTRKESEQLAGRFVDELIPKLQRQILLSSNRHLYIARKLKEVVGQAANVLSEHGKASGFSPVGLELPFGSESELPPLEFQLANGNAMQIIGRIDRVDAAQSSHGLLLRVIDYKSSQTSLSLTEVYFGIALQMLTYLDVVLTHANRWLGKDATPAGALYFHVHHPMIQSKNALALEEIEQKIFKDFKMKGLVLADEETVGLMDKTLESKFSDIIPVGLKKSGGFDKRSSVASTEQFDMIRGYVRNVIQQIGTDLTDGVIHISPYQLKDKKPCTYCSFKPVCQFDQSIKNNDYRLLRQEKDEDMLKKMLEKGGEMDAT
jgi:ATP-dependent helicase/nuclease subunit B